ncbi:MAG TPA: hypothetical protein VEK73_19705, partial [Xanthobacteraceae bacterium]|nr:hypothetical protein [Xanthobacteraceae bacterium]
MLALRNSRSTRSARRPSVRFRLLSDQQINRVKKTFPSAAHSCYKRRLTQWRFNDGFEEEESNAPRMVEQGSRRPQIVGEEEDAGADDRPSPQAFGGRGAAKGLCRGHFPESEEAAPAQAREVDPVSKTGVARRNGRAARNENRASGRTGGANDSRRIAAL